MSHELPEPLYPGTTVDLIGHDGNAFSIIGRVTRAMRQAGCASVDIANFQKEAMSGDYDNVLRTVMRYVDVN